MSLIPLRIGKLEVPLPIIQGGMAVRISLSPLAAAVANEGGIGLIGVSGMDVQEMVEEIRKAKWLSRGVIGINVMVAVSQFSELVKAAIREKIDLIVAGAGFSREAFGWAKEAGIPFIPIVSSLKAALLAERCGADAVIVEGKEAGGHLGTEKSLFSILPDIIKALKIPVIAAGGILKGKDIWRALSAGAKGVQIGTRFAASFESSAHKTWKETYLKARPEDIVLINSPVGMIGRAIRTLFVEEILKGKAPKPINYKRCVKCLKYCQKDYCIIDALTLAQQGDIERGLVFSGERVGEINEILPVKKIIKNLLAEVKIYQSGVNEVCQEG